MSRYFIDPNTKKNFDPSKKFGQIEDGNQLVYDAVTTSYSLNMPADYYLKQIQQALPSSKDASKWYVRPHHIESLTSHHNSIKDDVINTRYFSHYNSNFGKKQEIDEKGTCVDYIEKHIQALKVKQTVMAMGLGIDLDDIDQLK